MKTIYNIRIDGEKIELWMPGGVMTLRAKEDILLVKSLIREAKKNGLNGNSEICEYVKYQLEEKYYW